MIKKSGRVIISADKIRGEGFHFEDESEFGTCALDMMIWARDRIKEAIERESIVVSTDCHIDSTVKPA